MDARQEVDSYAGCGRNRMDRAWRLVLQSRLLVRCTAFGAVGGLAMPRRQTACGRLGRASVERSRQLFDIGGKIRRET